MKRAMPLFLLVLILGCNKLNSESDVTLKPGDLLPTEIDAIKSAQTVNVSAKGDGGKFDVFIYLSKDKTEVELNPEKAKAKVLDSKTGVTEAKLSATVPANEMASVLLRSADTKKVVVKLKLTN